MSKTKIKLLIIFIVIIYAFSMYITLKVYKNKNATNDKPLYYMYMITNDKEKYDKVTKSDFTKISVSNVELLTNENKKVSDNKETSDDYFFSENEIEEMIDKGSFARTEIDKFEMIKKTDFFTYDDVIKDKILNYSFSGLIAYEINYQKRISNSISVTTDNAVLKDDYKNVQKEFENNKNLEVDIFAQNKDTLEIHKIITNAKVIDINDEKAIVCISQNDMNILNENIDLANILLSMDDIENVEVYVYE